MRTLFTSFTLLVCAIIAQAVCDEYSPFEQNEKPKPFGVTALTNIWQGAGRWEHYEYAQPGQTSVIVSVEWTTNVECRSDCRLHMPSSGGRPPRTWDIWGLAHGGEAYTADLNGDGIPDYMVHTYSAGIGINFELSYMTFVLSSPTGYVAHCILCYYAEPTDLLDLNQDGKPEYLHKMFVYGEKGKDGRAHNYWVYNLLGFSGTDIVSANAVDSRFPKWVWYKFKPNHADTNQLTSEQKKRLWIEAWKWNNAALPDAETFTEEQGKPTNPSNVRAEVRH